MVEHDGEHSGNADKQGYSTRVSPSAPFAAPPEKLLHPFDPKQQVQCENSRTWPDEVLPEETQRRSSAGGAPGAWSSWRRAGQAAVPMQGGRQPCRGDWLRWEANRDSDSAATRKRERLSSWWPAGSQGLSVTQQDWAVSPVHEVPLYHVRTLELAGMAFWFLSAKELWLEKRRHRLIITLSSISAAPPRMDSSGPAPFPSSRTVRSKRDY